MMASPKPEPTALYLAIDSFVYRGPGGLDRIVKEDTRLLGSDDAVKAHPAMFYRTASPTRR